MADERLEVCRDVFVSWSAWDIERVLTLFDPECEWAMSQGYATLLPANSYAGHEGLRDVMGELQSMFDSLNAEIVEARASGDELMLRASLSARPRGSTVPVTAPPFAQVVEFRDGRISRITQTDDVPVGWDYATPVS